MRDSIDEFDLDLDDEAFSLPDPDGDREYDKEHDEENDEDNAEESEEEEDEEERKGKRGGLKVVLTILVILALLAAGFFAFRHFMGGRLPGGSKTAAVVAEPNDTAMPEPTASEENDASPADAEPEDTAEDGVPGETSELTPEPTPEPTPTPTPTPPPTPAPKTIPEEYVIPDVDPNDLTAVHAYIQEQLNTMAASPTFPNYVEITANDDCTVFTVVCNSLDESVAERASAEQMFEFGRMYAAYAGTTVDNIHIDYNNGIGNLLYARDSNKS